MKNFIIIPVLFFITMPMLQAQANKGQTSPDSIGFKVQKHHRIVFQLTSADTMAYKALMKQIRNITSVAPETEIEVVCHGPGLNMLVKEKTNVHPGIIALRSDKVRFVACEFSMKERNVSKEQIIPEAGFVQAGIIEIAIRQEEGWSYIKAGF